MPSPDIPVAGPPIMVEAHPFDFMASEIRDRKRLVAKLDEERAAAAAELRQAEQRFQEFVQGAVK